MKKFVLFLSVALLCVSCNGQNNKADKSVIQEMKKDSLVKPKGTWKVDKEYDEHGNLIRYDSLYSWSSHNGWDDFSTFDKDSLLQSFESMFYRDFSQFREQGFEDIFSQDSLFSKHFFRDDFFGSDFGKDFMNIDNIRQQMIARQKKLLEKYQLEFNKSEDKN